MALASIVARPLFRRLRGPTYVAVIADECAFFMSDEYSANADVEIINAIRPGLATTSGPLILASSPYAKRGILWDAFKRDYGKDGDPRVLVAKGPTLLFNQSLDPKVVHRALARDHAAASAEYLAEFRNDLAAFVPYEVVVQCVGDYTEQAPLATYRPYHAFVDPSGGSSDSMTLAIVHREGERIIVDAIREAAPPFSPSSWSMTLPT